MGERQDVLAVAQAAEGVSEALEEVDVSVPPGEMTGGAASEIVPVVAAGEAVVTEWTGFPQPVSASLNTVH